MPKFFCDYCDVYLTHDSQSGRKQHNRGRRHQENVRLFYTAFLRSHVQVGDPVTATFAPVPTDKAGHPLLQAALPPLPGEGRAPSSREVLVPGATGLAAFGLGGGGPLAQVLPGPILLIQPSTIPPLREAEPLREEDIPSAAAATQTSTIPVSVPAPLQPPPSQGLPPGAGVAPSPPGALPLPPPPFPRPGGLPLPPPPLPRPPPPPPGATGGQLPRPPLPPGATNGVGHPLPPPPPPQPGGVGGPTPSRGPAINPQRMAALGLHNLQ